MSQNLDVTKQDIFRRHLPFRCKIPWPSDGATLGADDYLKVVLIVHDPQNLVDDTLADYRDLFDRIAASAQPAS